MTHENIKLALAQLQKGKIAVVADDETRENEGDLILLAEHATPEAIAFFVRYTSGLLCIALPPERLDALNLPLMVSQSSDSQNTAFTISVDYKFNTSTGISAADRAATFRALADASVPADHFMRPGHVFPLRARPRGVLERRGHTEAAVDLARLAGGAPAAVLCELVNDDGSMMRGPQLREFAERHQLPFLSIEELADYRQKTEKSVQHTAVARIPTRHGPFAAHIYRSADTLEHVALVYGDVAKKSNVLVRVHSECFTGDVLGSTRCDCGEQLDAALALIAREGAGVLVYLRGHEGRGIGLSRKMHAYQLQDQGRDTVDANLTLGLPVDARNYDVGAQILTQLGVTSLRLLSNNPAKFTELAGYPLSIVDRVPLLITPTQDNFRYLRTKQFRLGHQLGLLNTDYVAAHATREQQAAFEETSLLRSVQ